MISKRLKSEHVVDKTVWPSKMGFFVYIILIGNGSNILPQSMKTLHKLSSGVFLSCLITTALLFAFPLIYMELFLGRYTRRTNVALFNSCPVFISMCIVILIMNFLLLPTETVRQSQFMWRAFWHAFLHDLDCLKKTPVCYDYKIRGPIVNDVCKTIPFGAMCKKRGIVRYPGQYNYWETYVNENSEYFRQWKLILFLLFTWSILTMCMFVSLRQLSKFLTVFFFLQLLTYVFILIMALFEYGTDVGLNKMKLLTFNYQIEYNEIVSMVIFGFKKIGFITPTGYTTLSAYAKFKSKFVQDAILIIIFDVFFTMLLCFTTNAVVIVIAHATNLTPEQIFLDDLGMYVGLFPEFFRYMDIPIVFTVIYFLVLGFSELGRIALSMYMVFLNIFDFVPSAKKFHTQIIICTCSISFVYTIAFTGMYTLNSVLPYVGYVLAHTPLMILITLEGIMVFYCYGVKRLSNDIYFMTGKPPMGFLTIIWIILPVATLCMSIFGIIQTDEIFDEALKNIHSHKIGHILAPVISNTVYAILALIPVISAIYVLWKKNLGEPFVNAFKPDFYWGPPGTSRRIARKSFSYTTQSCSTIDRQRVRLTTIPHLKAIQAAEEEGESMEKEELADIHQFQVYFKKMFKKHNLTKKRGRIFSDKRYFLNLQDAAYYIMTTNRKT